MVTRMEGGGQGEGEENTVDNGMTVHRGRWFLLTEVVEQSHYN